MPNPNNLTLRKIMDVRQQGVDAAAGTKGIEDNPYGQQDPIKAFAWRDGHRRPLMDHIPAILDGLAWTTQEAVEVSVDPETTLA